MRTNNRFVGFVGVVVLSLASHAFAQENQPADKISVGSVVKSVVKSVVLDPTTYAPAILGHVARVVDWKTSQPLFAAGYLERNPQYTVSGKSMDTPISYAAGRSKIGWEDARIFGETLATNASIEVGRRFLSQKFPSQRKLFTVLAWGGKIGWNGFVSYRQSAAHFRQAQWNRDILAYDRSRPALHP